MSEMKIWAVPLYRGEKVEDAFVEHATTEEEAMNDSRIRLKSRNLDSILTIRDAHELRVKPCRKE